MIWCGVGLSLGHPVTQELIRHNVSAVLTLNPNVNSTLDCAKHIKAKELLVFAKTEDGAIPTTFMCPSACDTKLSRMNCTISALQGKPHEEVDLACDVFLPKGVHLADKMQISCDPEDPCEKTSCSVVYSNGPDPSTKAAQFNQGLGSKSIPGILGGVMACLILALIIYIICRLRYSNRNRAQTFSNEDV